MGTCGWLLVSLVAFSGDATESVRPPGSFELVGVLHDDRALNRPHDVELQGNLAFVPGKGGSLAIIDVKDPKTPKLVSSLVDPAGLEEAETVLPIGDVLLLGTRDLLAIDIRDPARPKILKRISDRPRIDLINGMALFGHMLLAANKQGFIDAFDVRRPADPIFVGALNTREAGGPQRPHGVAMLGDRLIVVDTARAVRANVFIYRVATSAHDPLPPERWTLEGSLPGTADDNLFGANRVAVWDRYASVGAFVPDLVSILDLADPRKPRRLANLPVCDIDATGMTVSGRVVFVSGGECVEAIDVSDPAHPVSLAQYRGGRLFPTRRLMLDGRPHYDNGHDLVYRDGYLYVTAQNDNRFGVLRVADKKVLELAKP